MSKRKVMIAPSILSADFSKLGEEIKDVERAGCELIHVDVMDGHFVPNITIGPCVVKSAKKTTKLPFDVHLMIDEPIRYVEDFVKAGSDWITVHYEGCNDLDETIEKIKSLNVKAGISIKPATPLSAIKDYFDKVDLILIMTVEPGFGGQEFMRSAADKVGELRKLYKGLISVDGGINSETAKVVVAGGVDILVAGSYVFSQKDRKKAIDSLRP